MNSTEAKEQLSRVFVAYPSYRQWLEAQESGRETLQAWCGMLSTCDFMDVSSVVDSIVAGVVEPTTRYQKPDSLPINIRQRAKDLRAKRREISRMDDLHLQAIRQGPPPSDRFILAMRETRRCGNLCRDGKISPEENERRIVALQQWSEKHGPKPDWIDGLG